MIETKTDQLEVVVDLLRELDGAFVSVVQRWQDRGLDEGLINAAVIAYGMYRSKQRQATNGSV